MKEMNVSLYHLRAGRADRADFKVRLKIFPITIVLAFETANMLIINLRFCKIILPKSDNSMSQQAKISGDFLKNIKNGQENTRGGVKNA